MSAMSSTKTYRGSNAQRVTVESEHSVAVPLRHRARHSPDGFAWGYGGSGPADLALSILWDHLGREPSLSLYMDFKWDFVAKFGSTWALTSQEIDEWLAREGCREEVTPS